MVYDRYRVLKLDLESGRLAKQPVADTDVGLDEADRRESKDGEMRGLSLSRVASGDGRWAHTLYDGGGGVPFIHALDTVGDRAVCVFLPELEGLQRREIAKATLVSGPEVGTISVVDRAGSELARVDTSDFVVTTPGNQVGESSSDPLTMLMIGLASATVCVGLVAVIRRRRNEPAAPQR